MLWNLIQKVQFQMKNTEIIGWIPNWVVNWGQKTLPGEWKNGIIKGAELRKSNQLSTDDLINHYRKK